MWKHLLAALALAMFACCGSVQEDNSDAAPDAYQQGTDSGEAPDADPNAPDADPTAPDADPTTPDAASGDGGSAPTVCGGFAGLVCDPAYFCDWTPDSCGSADQTGECRIRPEFCPDIYDPVCGCNGMTYGNQCDANAAGQDIIHTGMCP